MCSSEWLETLGTGIQEETCAVYDGSDSPSTCYLITLVALSGSLFDRLASEELNLTASAITHRHLLTGALTCVPAASCVAERRM